MPIEEQTESKNEENELQTSPDVQKSAVNVVVDKKGRNGKVATIIEGFTISTKEIENLARELKQKLGVGGSIREGEILIQGDHKTAVKKFLTEKNIKAKGY